MEEEHRQNEEEEKKEDAENLETDTIEEGKEFLQEDVENFLENERSKTIVIHMNTIQRSQTIVVPPYSE